MKNERVEDLRISKEVSIKEQIEQFGKAGGFTAKKAAIASGILGEMFEGNCFRMLSFPAAIISTGTRGLIKEMVKRKLFDMVMTTCGTLDHDFARLHEDYLHGSFEADDAGLHKKGINRLGNIFIPNKSYGEVIEKELKPILNDIYSSGKRELATYELVWEIGKRLKGNREESIIWWCAKNQIPVIIPGITDGAFGLQLVIFMQDHPDFRVDVFKDEKYLIEMMFGLKKSGALMIGGGISKHHVIWWSQFSGGLDYAVYITTAPEWDGSLSGARTGEAISWGKVNEKAKHITVEGDATVLLPLIVGPHL